MPRMPSTRTYLRRSHGHILDRRPTADGARLLSQSGNLERAHCNSPCSAGDVKDVQCRYRSLSRAFAAGSPSEGLGHAAGQLECLDWDGELCVPFRVWATVIPAIDPFRARNPKQHIPRCAPAREVAPVLRRRQGHGSDTSPASPWEEQGVPCRAATVPLRTRRPVRTAKPCGPGVAAKSGWTFGYDRISSRAEPAAAPRPRPAPRGNRGSVRAHACRDLDKPGEMAGHIRREDVRIAPARSRPPITAGIRARAFHMREPDSLRGRLPERREARPAPSRFPVVKCTGDSGSSRAFDWKRIPRIVADVKRDPSSLNRQWAAVTTVCSVAIER